MAGSPRLLQAFYRLFFGFWIPVLAWASTRCPPRLMYWMARRLVVVPFALLRGKYMMFEHAYHWIDFFRWSQLSAERLRGAVAVVEGEERFLAARRSGRGTVLLTAHMGNPEVGAVALGKSFEPIHVLYWRDRFATAEEFRTRMRRLGNVEGIAVDASPLSVVPALRVLRQGGLLAAHGDRDPSGRGVPLEFFGAPAPFPLGPFLLAARSGALILPTFFLLERDRRFHVIYEAPIDLAGDGPEAPRVRAAMQGWLRLLERRVRERPEQWYCFYPFWQQATARR
jgi:lauroyl/myristoyl acyltransferase